MANEGIKARVVGRSSRLKVGILMTLEGARHLIDPSPGLPARTAGVVLGEIAIYTVLHLVMSRFFLRVNHCASMIVATTAVVLVFVFGGPAGSLGTLIFVGVSLVLAAIRAEGGCEVMTLPGMVLGNRTHLACVIFSPIDWVQATVDRIKENVPEDRDVTVKVFQGTGHRFMDAETGRIREDFLEYLARWLKDKTST